MKMRDPEISREKVEVGAGMKDRGGLQHFAGMDINAGDQAIANGGKLVGKPSIATAHFKYAQRSLLPFKILYKPAARLFPQFPFSGEGMLIRHVGK